MNIDTDNQFETYRIRRVNPERCGEQAGWTLSFEEGSCIWCTAETCAQQPEIGETVRLYGKGFGYTVRGIAISGRVYRYLTEEQEAERHAQWCADWQRKQDDAKVRHEAEIAKGQHAPAPFAIKPSARADYELGLSKNTDPYGRCCYLFAADWAALMEKEIAAGKTVAAVAKEASRAADQKHGVTGFMYGVAVSLLSHCWEHGEELRRWHNLDTQVGKEGERANETGGVLNPAVLTVDI